MVQKFHSDILNRYRGDFLNSHILCGWSSKHSQEARFSALLSTMKYNGGSIVDYGCGTGDLYAFIVKKYGQVKYTGVDSSGEMIEIARNQYNTNFILCDFDEIDFDHPPQKIPLIQEG